MPLSKLEKIIIGALADITVHITEIGKTQVKIANFISQHIPNLSEDEKQEVLTHAETSWLQVQSLQDKAKKLKALL